MTENFTPPHFTRHDILYATDELIVARARDLFLKGKVELLSCHERGYFAVVSGTKPYHVSLSTKRVDMGTCDCYMGKRDEFCKHLLALAWYVLIKANPDAAKPPQLTEKEAKKQIVAGTRKFTGFGGGSREWWSYQQKLDIGAGMIEEALLHLPNEKRTITYLWNLVVKLCTKIQHGVDDSNGTCGECITTILHKITEVASSREAWREYAITHCTDDTGFGFEDELHALLRK